MKLNCVLCDGQEKAFNYTTRRIERANHPPDTRCMICSRCVAHLAGSTGDERKALYDKAVEQGEPLQVAALRNHCR